MKATSNRPNKFQLALVFITVVFALIPCAPYFIGILGDVPENLLYGPYPRRVWLGSALVGYMGLIAAIPAIVVSRRYSFRLLTVPLLLGIAAYLPGGFFLFMLAAGAKSISVMALAISPVVAASLLVVYFASGKHTR